MEQMLCQFTKQWFYQYNINKITKVAQKRKDIGCPKLLDNSKSFGFIPKILDGESGQASEGLFIFFF